eukprot:746849-Hanusia_phi.AAC.3
MPQCPYDSVSSVDQNPESFECVDLIRNPGILESGTFIDCTPQNNKNHKEHPELEFEGIAETLWHFSSSPWGSLRAYYWLNKIEVRITNHMDAFVRRFEETVISPQNNGCIPAMGMASDVDRTAGHLQNFRHCYQECHRENNFRRMRTMHITSIASKHGQHQPPGSCMLSVTK